MEGLISFGNKRNYEDFKKQIPVGSLWVGLGAGSLKHFGEAEGRQKGAGRQNRFGNK